MIYLIIIVLVIVGFFEFILIKRGMRAGKRASSPIRGGSESSPSTPFTNRYVERKESGQESFLKQKNLVESADRGEKVTSFPEQSWEATDSADIKREIRQKESPLREQSTLDIIQEIRGESVYPGQDSHELFQEHLDTETKQEEMDDINAEDQEESFADAADAAEIHGVDSESEDIGSEPAMFEDIEESQEVEEEESPEELIKSALDLVRQGDFDEGIEKIEAVIEYVPEKADAHFNLGIAYTLKENIPQAISAYQRAIEIEPQYGKAFFNLGTLYLKQGKIQEAIAKLEQAVKLLPDSMKAFWNLYEAYRSSGLFTKALSSLQKLIELEPEDASLHNHLGICYVKLGDYTKAINSWKRSIDLGASSPLVHYNLGKTYELYGDFTAAKKHYKHFLVLTSKTSDWQELVSEVQDRLDNLERSLF